MAMNNDDLKREADKNRETLCRVSSIMSGPANENEEYLGIADAILIEAWKEDETANSIRIKIADMIRQFHTEQMRKRLIQWMEDEL
jgi:hypothetical protein